MKEVIFHFFPSVRFLGLSLKILFHKNKEIKRMLSKKMTFSLMSLITLLAFAFVAPSAMAAAFEIKVAGPTSVSYAAGEDGEAILTGTVAEVEVKLKVSSGQPIADFTYALPVADPDTNEITVAAFDEDGFAVVLTNSNVTVEDLPRTSTQPDADVYATKTPKEHQLLVTITPGTTDTIARVVISIKGALTSTDPTLAAADAVSKADAVRHTITLTDPVDISGVPSVVSVQRLRPGSQTAISAFQEVRIAAVPFNVRIVLTAPPHGIDLADVNNFIEVQNGTVSGLVTGVKFARIGIEGADADDDMVAASTLRPHPIEGMYAHVGTTALEGVPEGFDDVNVPMPNDVDDMYSQYRVTITPHQKSANFDVKIRVKSFHDNGAVLRRTYLPPGFDAGANGRDVLRVPVSGTARNLTAGYRVRVKKDKIIPAGGYLVIAKDKGGSEVEAGPGPAGAWRIKDTPRATHRTPAQLLYNVIDEGDLHDDDDLPNLATQFLTGVVVDVESQHAGLVISEVMWGEDTSLNPSSKSQYIELYNPGGQYKTAADADHTPDVNEALTLIFYAPNEFDDVPAVDAAGDLATGLTDRIGTLDATGSYWNPVGKGQSGRSGTLEADADGELTAGRGPFVDAVPIVSMYRAMDAAGAVEDGQMAASWMTSAGPKSANFDPLAIGVRHGTPGAATDATTTPADTAAEAKAAADKAAAAVKKTESTGTMPEDGQIYISEIMFAGGGILPQWIEISNGSRTEEINLSGWTITVDNAAADADVSIGASATFTISDGTTIDPSGQDDTPSTILVVTEQGRNNVEDSGQVLNLLKANEVDLILAGVVTRKYTLLSGMAFMVTLAPPEPEATKPPADETAGAKATRQAAEKKAAAKRKAATDMVGNLGADGAAAWALPMSEDGRSSIIRRHVQVAIGAAAPDDGTMMDSWVLASDTSFAAPTHIRVQSYYGAANDVGTPGFRAGGALPVELSHFRPERNKDTGAVVITWSTQSELNNAGFFIKRSQQRDGEFKVINATMIQGAGTISEKQFYTYNDSTAQPNVVYYYQIEDVSLDGNRQTLTKGIRLKGHVSVAGKLTTLWGDLKTSQ